MYAVYEIVTRRDVERFLHTKMIHCTAHEHNNASFSPSLSIYLSFFFSFCPTFGTWNALNCSRVAILNLSFVKIPFPQYSATQCERVFDYSPGFSEDLPTQSEIAFVKIRPINNIVSSIYCLLRNWKLFEFPIGISQRHFFFLFLNRNQTEAYPINLVQL